MIMIMTMIVIIRVSGDLIITVINIITIIVIITITIIIVVRI